VNLKIKIAFTIIDGFSRGTYTMNKLQGIPKTENLTEPENRNGKSTTNQNTSKAIYYIQRKS
jgi:hypothetical protein